jgi:hypothetical protein
VTEQLRHLRQIEFTVSAENAPPYSGAFLASETVWHEGREYLVRSLTWKAYGSFDVKLVEMPSVGNDPR